MWVDLLLVQGAMQEAGRHKVHSQRPPLLQLGSDLQRGGCRGYREGEHQRGEDGVDQHEPQLGAELAIQLRFGRSGALLQGHRQRPPHLHLMEYCSG